MYNNKIDTWDYIWYFNCLDNEGVTCLPNVNLVKNIGFDVGATHTQKTSDKKANLPLQSIEFPLSHPDTIEINHKADKYTSKNYYKLNFRRDIIIILKKLYLFNIIIKIKGYLATKYILKGK